MELHKKKWWNRLWNWKFLMRLVTELLNLQIMTKKDLDLFESFPDIKHGRELCALSLTIIAPPLSMNNVVYLFIFKIIKIKLLLIFMNIMKEIVNLVCVTHPSIMWFFSRIGHGIWISNFFFFVSVRLVQRSIKVSFLIKLSSNWLWLV